jgi:hypothetical protein
MMYTYKNSEKRPFLSAITERNGFSPYQAAQIAL